MVKQNIWVTCVDQMFTYPSKEWKVLLGLKKRKKTATASNPISCMDFCQGRTTGVQ